ncbi:hypothetical protein Tsubulata_015976 [Turnera subulata]|uniref:Uncharacterized protein n=1 Tax=Turnera subulata TaxID=218843 RepID=A0A9Q0FJ50_9ROSI|nr:hypothetical protein Tsubulata_015976 [Turnera subulata]
MASTLPVLGLCLFSLVFLSTPHLSLSQKPDFHDVLLKYGLPRGLIPNNVDSYAVEGASGYFTVWLSRPCVVRLGSIQLWYSDRITGRISSAFMTELDGILAQIEKITLPLTLFQSIFHGRFIRVRVGTTIQNLDGSLFEDIPVCLSADEPVLVRSVV